MVFIFLFGMWNYRFKDFPPTDLMNGVCHTCGVVFFSCWKENILNFASFFFSYDNKAYLLC